MRNSNKVHKEADEVSVQDTLADAHNVHNNWKRKAEPATDDEPISSSDESEQLTPVTGLSPRFGPSARKTFEWSAKDLEKKLAEGDAAANDRNNNGSGKEEKKTEAPTRRGGRRSERLQNSPLATPKKTTGKLMGVSEREDEEAELFPSIVSSSRPAKRRKPMVYGSGIRNIHALPKREVKAKVSAPGLDPDETDVAIHSSQTATSAPEFKNPISFPNDTISRFSLQTSSSREIENLVFDPDEDDRSLSPLSSVPSSISQGLSPAEQTWLDSAGRRPNVCPICKQRVDDAFWEKFGSNKALSVRKQVKFCRAHRKQSAEQEWFEKGYPTIAWEQLDRRIRTHFSDLEKILTLKTPSFYRNALESSVSGGKKDNFRLTITSDGLDSMSAGYYGSRGSKQMCVC
jgi:hypothetical protein